MDYDETDESVASSNRCSIDDGNYFEDEIVSSRRTPWDIITPQNIHQYQNEMLKEVSEVLACRPAISRILLVEYCWDKAALINDYAERGREVVFRRAGCPSEEASELPVVEGMALCGCCFCEVKQEGRTAMICGHSFCNDCWKRHAELQIGEGNSCRIKCMGFKCGLICDEDMIERLLSGSGSVLERYQHSLLESYVNDNSNVKWCPSIPNCGNAVRNNRDECCEPTCSCGLHFCFSCLKEAHSPCSCDMWTDWERKKMDDSETINWLTANTKACPKCGKLVEKNGGCNLMTCRCGQHFCWLCGGATGFDHTYHTITNHQCGRWKETLDRSIGEAACNHKRYMHYFSRWSGHRDSLKKERTNEDVVLTHLQSLCDALKTRLFEYDALLSCVRVLTSARLVLSNSYAFAFFLSGRDWYADEVHPGQTSLNQALFEDMQQQLEGEIERLSKLLSDREIEYVESEITDHLLGVLNCSRTVMKRMQNFYEAINSGLLGQLEQTIVSIADFMPCNLHI